jgi:valyl-tRNA synthetase
MTKDLKVMFDTEDDNDLIVKMLKLDQSIVKKPLGQKAYKVFSNRVKATIFFEKIETKTEAVLKKQQIKLLKINDNIVTKPTGEKEYKVFSNRVKATIFFSKTETEEELKLKENQIKELEASIKRREALLSNENYVNKAPANIVEMDRQKLADEKKKLAELKKED